MVIRVESGRVTGEWKLDEVGFLDFRDQQFAKYRETERFRETLDSMREDAEQEDEELGVEENDLDWSSEEFLERYLYNIAIESYLTPIFDDEPSLPPTPRR